MFDRNPRPRHPRSLALAAALVVAIAGPACSQAERAPEQSARVRIVTTVAPITSIVSSVVGEHATVTGLIPEGVDSHTFEPPPSAARALARADIVFLNGLMLEDPTRALARRNNRGGAEVVELGNRVLPPDSYIFDDSYPREAGKPNPHLWTSPPLALDYARIVRDVISERDPAHAAEYARNYDAFASKVDSLDRAMTAASATVPRRDLLTYHDAYAYFAKHYGWRVIGAIQVADHREPSPHEVAALIDQVKRTGVTAIFGSEVFSSPVLAQIARETGVRYVDDLRDDDLPGDPGHPEHSWLGLMKFNFVTMVSSLGGDASGLRAVDVSLPFADTAKYAL